MLLAERSKSENSTCCVIPTLWHSKKDKSMKTIKKRKISGCQGLGGGRNEQTKYREFKAVKLFYYNDG